MDGTINKTDDVIVDVTNSQIEVFESKEIADDLIESYFKSGNYGELPANVMYQVYNDLIDFDFSDGILNDKKITNDYLNNKKNILKSIGLLTFILIFILVFSPLMEPILVGGVFKKIVIGYCTSLAVSLLEEGIYIKNSGKKLERLIKKISNDYCLLPADDYKRLKELRSEGIRTKELIELEHKEMELKGQYKELEAIKQEKERQKLIEEEIDNASQQVNNNLNILNDLIDEKYQKIKKYVVPRDILFTEVDGIIRFSENIKENLRYIDLSFVDFSNVDVSGVDFSDCNPVLLDPQTVYNKDLSDTVFINDPKRVNNVFPFGASTNFNGVNLTNAEIVSKMPIIINYAGAIINEESNIENENKFVKIKK